MPTDFVLFGNSWRTEIVLFMVDASYFQNNKFLFLLFSF